MLQVTYLPSEQHLLDVAQACRETQYPGNFTMAMYADSCGTPGCALGNYAARKDLQNVLSLSKEGNLVSRCRHAQLGWLLDWFGINPGEWSSLFGLHGCNRAQTASDAAEYIERFVSQKVAARLSV